MIRIPRDNVISTTTATTMSTIRVANWFLSFTYQRRRAVDLQHLDPRTGLEGLVLVERAGAPDLAADLDLAAAAVHALEHDRGRPDERGRARAQLRRGAQVAAGDRAQRQQGRGGDRREHDPLERDPAAGQRD